MKIIFIHIVFVYSVLTYFNHEYSAFIYLFVVLFPQAVLFFPSVIQYVWLICSASNFKHYYGYSHSLSFFFSFEMIYCLYSLPIILGILSARNCHVGLSLVGGCFLTIPSEVFHSSPPDIRPTLPCFSSCHQDHRYLTYQSRLSNRVKAIYPFFGKTQCALASI